MTTQTDTLSSLISATNAETSPIPPAEKIQLTELIIVIAEMQATWLERLIEAIESLHPSRRATRANPKINETIITTLKKQLTTTIQTAQDHRASLVALRARYPNLNTPPLRENDCVLHKYDHLTYPLPTLMQTLPGDITNQKLTSDQLDMCKSVAALAYDAGETIFDGIEAITKLLNIAGDKTPPELIAPLAALIAHITAEARFMGYATVEYGAAGEMVGA